MKAVLQVEHRGVWKMVGKVFTLPWRLGDAPGDPPTHVFVHRESGTQRHRNTGSPGGIDALVLSWLEDHGVETVYHVTPNGWLRTSTQKIRDHGEIETWDTRTRFFLAQAYWRNVEPISDPWIPEQYTRYLGIGPKVASNPDAEPGLLDRLGAEGLPQPGTTTEQAAEAIATVAKLQAEGPSANLTGIRPCCGCETSEVCGLCRCHERETASLPPILPRVVTPIAEGSFEVTHHFSSIGASAYYMPIEDGGRTHYGTFDVLALIFKDAPLSTGTRFKVTIEELPDSRPEPVENPWRKGEFS